MKLSYLVKGFPGHPLHPPLTDVTIGLYTGATALVFCPCSGSARATWPRPGGSR
jgi:hypothetical protein